MRERGWGVSGGSVEGEVDYLVANFAGEGEEGGDLWHSFLIGGLGDCGVSMFGGVRMMAWWHVSCLFSGVSMTWGSRATLMQSPLTIEMTV